MRCAEIHPNLVAFIVGAVSGRGRRGPVPPGFLSQLPEEVRGTRERLPCPSGGVSILLLRGLNEDMILWN
jgi:hypothetical protein